MQQRIGDRRVLIGGFPLTVVPDQRTHINILAKALLEDINTLNKLRLECGG